MSAFSENPYQAPQSLGMDGSGAPGRPELWNPNAAAGWSLLFTPAFGAYLHALNWRTLGNSDEARRSMTWVWTTVAYLAINFATVFLPQSPGTDRLMQWAGFGLLIGWYVSQGKKQSTYVKDTLHNDYARRGWGKPLAIGFALAVLYFAVVFAAVLILFEADPGLLDDQLGP